MELFLIPLSSMSSHLFCCSNIPSQCSRHPAPLPYNLASYILVTSSDSFFKPLKQLLRRSETSLLSRQSGENAAQGSQCVHQTARHLWGVQRWSAWEELLSHTEMKGDSSHSLPVLSTSSCSTEFSLWIFCVTEDATGWVWGREGRRGALQLECSSLHVQNSSWPRPAHPRPHPEGRELL